MVEMRLLQQLQRNCRVGESWVAFESRLALDSFHQLVDLIRFAFWTNSDMANIQYATQVSIILKIDTKLY